jgi:hypothetical protein
VTGGGHAPAALRPNEVELPTNCLPGKMSPMNPLMNTSIAALAGLAFAASLAAPSEAQRRPSAPPPLEAVFTPVETRVEVNGDRTTVTFGDRTYQLEPLRDPRSPERGAQMMLQGEGAWPNFEGTGFDRGRFQSYFGRSGPNEFWLLPGFGLVAASDYVDRRSGNRHVRRDLIRGRDGTLEPALPGRPAFWEPHFVTRSGVQANGLIAERTLVITGSLTAYQPSGAGPSAILHPLDSTVSFAWLFDEQGVIRQWSPLADLSGNSGSTAASANAFAYHRQSDQGHVTFATLDENGALEVHVVSPDLQTIITHSGVLRLKQRREDPSRIATTTSAIGGMVRESREQNLDANGTLLLAPMPGHEGWYGVLESNGSLTVPGDGLGLIPISRTISSGAFYQGMLAIDYQVATAFVIAFQTGSGIRYGWASSELSAHTGPIWRDVRLQNSPRLADAAPELNPQLLLAQFEEGYWRAYVEPEVHIPTSTWQAPNTFSGFVPPAASSEQAFAFAESVLIQMTQDINRADWETYRRTLGYMQAERRAEAQERARRSAERQAFWSAAIGAALTGMAQAEPMERPEGRRPSALGPDFYWEGDALYYSGAGRRVRVD